MRKATRISLALGTSAALLSLSALPASAVEGDIRSAEVDSTIEVPNQGISISVAQVGTPVVADVSRVDSDLARTATIPVQGVSVTDLRATNTGWNLSVTLDDFTAAGLDPIKADAAVYTLGDVVTIGEIKGFPTSVPFDRKAPAEKATAGFTPELLGNNKASWNPVVKVGVPAKTLNSNYTATLTHSLL